MANEKRADCTIGVAKSGPCIVIGRRNLHRVHAKRSLTQEEPIGMFRLERFKGFKYIRFKEFSTPERLNPKPLGGSREAQLSFARQRSDS